MNLPADVTIISGIAFHKDTSVCVKKLALRNSQGRGFETILKFALNDGEKTEVKNISMPGLM